MPFHDYSVLVHKLELVTITVDDRSAHFHDAGVLITMIASLDAVHIYPNVPISPIGNKKPCVSHSVLLSSLEW